MTITSDAIAAALRVAGSNSVDRERTLSGNDNLRNSLTSLGELETRNATLRGQIAAQNQLQELAARQIQQANDFHVMLINVNYYKSPD